MEAAADACGADRVELVDEDDCRRVLACLVEELADSRRPEPREELDERGSALRVEVRARRARHRLGQERLSRARRPVQEDAPRNARPEALETLAVPEELDHLLQLGLRLVEPCDVRPRHVHLRAPHDGRRLRARHEPHRVEQQDDDDPEEHDREPGQERVLEVHLRGLSAALRAVSSVAWSSTEEAPSRRYRI